MKVSATAHLKAICLLLFPAALAWELAPHGTVPTPPYYTNAGRSEIRVTTAAELQSATWNVNSDTTIIVAPGTYNLDTAPYSNGQDGRLTIGRYGATPVQRVELRGETGNPEDVVLVGAGRLNSALPSCIHIFSAQDVLISGMTIKQCYYHSIHVDAAQGAREIKMHSLILTESGQQLVKFSSNGAHDSSIEWSHLSSGGAGNPNHPDFGNACYTNAIDINGQHNDFFISKITIEDYRCADGSMPGPAILMWNGVRNTVVDSIAMIDITRGIAFGLVQRSGYNDHYGGSITNCMITQKVGQAGTDVAISLVSPNTYVAHNTILTRGAYPNPIETRFSSTTGVIVHANVMDGSVRRRNSAQATEQNTVDILSENWFVDALGGDLRLTATGASAIPTIAREVSTDFDGNARPDPTTIGASDGASAPPGPSTPAPTSAPTVTGGCTPYFTVENGNVNFAEAVANTPSGCVLAPIRSSTDLVEAATQAGSQQCLVGITKPVSVGDTAGVDGWLNLDGSSVPADGSLWKAGEPNNTPGPQGVATINYGSSGRLRDVRAGDVFPCAVYKCCDSTSVTTSPPTSGPTVAATEAPTRAPTAEPTVAATSAPTNGPTADPTTPEPTNGPTADPTAAPTTGGADETSAPTAGPTTVVTMAPTVPETETTNMVIQHEGTMYTCSCDVTSGFLP